MIAIALMLFAGVSGASPQYRGCVWRLHEETALLPYKLATFDLGVDEWIVESSKDDAIVTFLELRSMAQIRALSRLEYHKYFRAWIKDDIEMGTGLYWAEYWDCKNFVSYINTGGGQIV